MGRSRTSRRRRPTVSVALALCAVLIPGGWWLADRGADHAVGVTTASASQPALQPARQPALQPYRDPAAGFSISHPAGWRPEAIEDGVLFRIGGQDAVSVKRTTLAQPVSGANVADMRAVTDAVLGAPELGLKLLQAAPTTLGGLPGMHYLYTFDAGGVRGAHTHWFAFSGRTMYTVVFQALPDQRFAALAPTFDAVAATFRTLDS